MEKLSTITSMIDTLREKADSIIHYAMFFGILVVAFLLVSSMFRFLFGKKAQIGKAITSAMEILCLYMICIVIYSFGLHWDLFVNPLPFMSLQGDTLLLFPILTASFSEICTQVLELLILAFLVNLMNSIIPEGKKLLVWLALRVVTVVLAVIVNGISDVLLNQWMPDGLSAIAPIALIAVLVVLILLGSLKILVGAAMTIANPVIGVLYTFFFSNFIGRALARSILSTALVTGLVVLLNAMNLAAIPIAAAGLIAFIPFLLLLILLWYVVDRIV